MMIRYRKKNHCHDMITSTTTSWGIPSGDTTTKRRRMLSSNNNNKNNNRINNSLLIIVTCCYYFLCFHVHAVSSQRAIFSLGQKLHKRFQLGNSNNEHKDQQKQHGTYRRKQPTDDDNDDDVVAKNAWNKFYLSFVSLSLFLPSFWNGSDDDHHYHHHSTTPTTAVVTILLSFAVILLGGIYTHYDRRRRRMLLLRNTSRSSVDDELYQELSKHDQKMEVSFEGLQLILKKKKRGETRLLLDGSISGRVQPGRMLAIMGPSGAGKSTVLHALAGRIKYSNQLQLYGRRYINGVPVSTDSMIPAAFIAQDVSFFPYMTVRETLSFRVELKLGSLLNQKARDDMVNDLLDELGLTKAADTIVGDQKVRGISGGERKRLSIAVEMIGSPSVIFLDEPTSGLDSTAANSLVQTLRELADNGKTVIAVIHQPNQHVFSKFDDVLLVSEGKQMYFGPRQDVRSYMEQYGCVALPETGTSEHILDCISRQAIGDESDEEVVERMERLATKARESTINIGALTKNGVNGSVQVFSARNAVSGPRANIVVQFRLLLQRSLREVFRGKVAIILGLVRQVSTALIFGGIYNIGTNQASIQDRFGLLSLIAIGAMNMAVAQTIRTFPREKAIVANELASNMYRTLPYFVGKAISELPMVGFFNGIFGVIVYKLTGLSSLPGKLLNFLGLLTVHGVLSQAAGLLIGSISPNSDVALAIFPAVVVLNIIFDGKNIAEESIPKVLRWIPNVGLIRWGYEGLCLNEFDGLKFEASGGRGGPIAKTGADALARFGLGTRSLNDVVRAQIQIASACWILSYIGFTITRQKFLTMLPPLTE